MFMALVLVIVILAYVYFSVPERTGFLQGRFSWWKALIDIVIQ